jgi:tetratricopeptide (TPR) repeat protein
MQSRLIKEKLNDKKELISTLNNIAYLYEDQGEIEKALEFYNKGLTIANELNNKSIKATLINNIAGIYLDRNKLDTALKYYLRSLDLMIELKRRKGSAVCLNNIGLIYKKLNDLNKAASYYNESLKIREEINDKQGITNSLINIGQLHNFKKEYTKAIEFGNQSLKIAKSVLYPIGIRGSAEMLVIAYKGVKDQKRALENYELYIQMRDSLTNEATKKISIKSQLKYEYEKQAAADSVVHAKASEIKNVELEKQRIEIKAKQNQQYALFGGLGLVLIFAGFMFNRFKVTQKQKQIIEQQKEVVEAQKKIVEEHQKEVLDSIHYARRIQMAQIPSEKRIEIYLNKLRKK